MREAHGGDSGEQDGEHGGIVWSGPGAGNTCYGSGVDRVLASARFGSGLVEVVRGDLTLQSTDAIVNAANTELAHGGGVAGAIVARGGMSIQEESWDRAPVPVGGAAVTGAGTLPCKHVIHAVGPMWGEGDEGTKLASAVSSALECARALGLVSVALPAISTGIFGVPKPLGCRVIVREVRRHLLEEATTLRTVRLVSIDEETAAAFAAALASI